MANQNLDEELKAIHAKILAVGDGLTAENLSKSLAGQPLAKAKPQPELEDEEEEDGSGYEDEDMDEDEEEDEGDELDEDEDEEEAPPPPARTKKSLQGRRKADEEFLKSLLLDERDKRTPMSHVIEATPVLSHISDVFAKSLANLDDRMGEQSTHAAEIDLMVKSLVVAVIDLKNQVKKLTISNNSRVATQPASGMNYSVNAGLPNAPRKEAKPLNKSLMGEIMQLAIEKGHLDQETGSRALLTLDSSGPDAALAYIYDEPLRDVFRKYAEQSTNQ